MIGKTLIISMKLESEAKALVLGFLNNNAGYTDLFLQ